MTLSMELGFFASDDVLAKYPDQVNETSDCESGASCNSINYEEKSKLFGEDLVRLNEGEALHPIIKNRFLSGLNCYGLNTEIVGIHRITYSGCRRQAKLEAFSVFLKAMEKKDSGSDNNDTKGNARYAWYGGSKDEIDTLVKFGFGVGGDSSRGGVYGKGVHLSPVDYPLDSLRSCIVDRDGLRHVLLCRVVVGRMEEVRAGSGQTHPSRDDFDSGVDSLASPRQYIVWSANVNTHILPEFVVSFRAPPSLQDCQRRTIPAKKAASPWMPFPALVTQLSMNLPADAINLIKKHHKDNRERKITKQELVQRVRSIAGDELLISAVKSYRNMVNLPTNNVGIFCF